jgi:BCD family chlorophyll transporter-like MFS transporter
LNIIAVWKQEARNPNSSAKAQSKGFQVTWKKFTQDPKVKRFLIMLGLGTAAFSMQDIILEPYGERFCIYP